MVRATLGGKRIDVSLTNPDRKTLLQPVVEPSVFLMPGEGPVSRIKTTRILVECPTACNEELKKIPKNMDPKSLPKFCGYLC